MVTILEEWAAWERCLEEEAKKSDAARNIKQAADQMVPQLATEKNAARHRDQKTYLTGEPTENSSCYVAPGRFGKMPDAAHSTDDVARPPFTTNREWRRTGRRNTVTGATRQAWGANQPRRRNSGKIPLDEGNDLPWWKKRDSSQVRQKSFSEAMAKCSWKGGKHISVAPRRATVLGLTDPNAFAPRETSPLHRARQTVRSVRSQERVVVPKGTRNTVTPWHSRKTDAKPSSWPEIPFGGWFVPAEGDTTATHLTPRSPAQFAGGRASPWARSTSRETAGGVLVKHSFFYGSGSRTRAGNTAGREGWPDADRSFESAWMRKFREEIERNPDWWTENSQHHLGLGNGNANIRDISLGTSRREGLGRTRLTTGAAALEKGGENRRRGAQRTALWEEVRSLLAASRCGDNGGKMARHKTAAINSQGVDVLSFGDRLRCTPLSQGAWIEDHSRRARSDSLCAIPDGGTQVEVDITTKKQNSGPDIEQGNGKHGQIVETETGVQGDVCDYSNPQGNDSRGRRGGALKRKNASTAGESREDLRRVHDSILTRLRGKIDSVTREEIILRAAEDARGALARDGLSSAVPRRAHATAASRPSTGWSLATTVPESIDYDKVEATLSLIELAARAAGPDAGRQMLSALEGLEKMHQRASIDGVAGYWVAPDVERYENKTTKVKDYAKKNKAASDSEAVGSRILNLNGDIPVRESSNADQVSASGAFEEYASHNDKPHNDKAVGGAAAAFLAKDIKTATGGISSLRGDATGDDRAARDDAPAVKSDAGKTADSEMDRSTSFKPGDVLVGGKKEEDGKRGKLSPKISVAMKASSDNATAQGDGDTPSTGMIQSIGSWLRGITEARSRKNNFFSFAGAVDQDHAESGGNARVRFLPLGKDSDGSIPKVTKQKGAPKEEEPSGMSLETCGSKDAQIDVPQLSSNGESNHVSKTSDAEEERLDDSQRKPKSEEDGEEKTAEFRPKTDPAPAKPCTKRYEKPCPTLWDAQVVEVVLETVIVAEVKYRKI